MKAKREQVIEELMIIKLFAGNYARDLLIEYSKNWIIKILIVISLI
jgi:hypothetical protein